MLKKTIVLSMLFGCSVMVFAQEKTVKEDSEITITTAQKVADTPFDYDAFAKKFLTVDKVPADFPKEEDYTSRETFIDSIIAWAENHKDIVNAQAVKDWKAKQQNKRALPPENQR